MGGRRFEKEVRSLEDSIIDDRPRCQKEKGFPDLAFFRLSSRRVMLSGHARLERVRGKE